MKSNKNQISMPLVALIALVSISCARQEPEAQLVGASRAGDGVEVVKEESHQDGSSVIGMQDTSARELPDHLDPHRAVANRLKPENEKIRNAYASGDWQTMLDTVYYVEDEYEAAGMPAPFLNKYKAEALIGLGRYREAGDVYAPDDPNGAPVFNLTSALAYAHTGELDAGAAARIESKAYEYFSREVLPSQLPAHPRRNDIIAAVHLARAVDAHFTALDEIAIREARAALALVPDHPVAAYVVAKSMSTAEQALESEQYWRIATAMPGKYGEKAEVTLEMIVSMRQRATTAGEPGAPTSIGR